MKISQQLTAISACAVAMIALVAGSASYCVAQLTESHDAVYKSASTIENTQSVCFHLSYASAAQRAYLITGRDTSLDLYHNEANATREALEELLERVKDSPEQHDIGQRLQREVNARMANLETTLHLFESKGQLSAFERVKAGAGAVAMTNSVQEANELRESLVAESNERRKATEKIAANTGLTIIWGSILAATIISLSNLFFSKHLSTAVRTLLRASQNVARDRFESLADVPGDNELGDIGRAFNTLSGHLKERTERLDKYKSNMESSEAELEDKQEELDSIRLQIFELNSSIDGWSSELGYSVDNRKRFQHELADALSVADMIGDSIARINDSSRETLIMAETLFRRGNSLSEGVDEFLHHYKRVSTTVDSVWNSIPETKELVTRLEGFENELSLLDLVSAMQESRNQSSSDNSGVVHDRLQALRKSLSDARSNLNVNITRIQQKMNDAVDATRDFEATMSGASRPLAAVATDTKFMVESTSKERTELVSIERLQQRQALHLDELSKLMTLLEVSNAREHEFVAKIRLRTAAMADAIDPAEIPESASELFAAAAP